MAYNAIDLFSGCGGMTEGLINAGFNVIAAIEIDKHAARVYRLNHEKHDIHLFEEDIRNIETQKILDLLKGQPLHLLAGCPPCQGFSSIRRRNKKRASKDSRNSLILEYLRFVEELQPITIMMENVPGLENYTLFKKVYSRLKKIGYKLEYKVVDVAAYGVPQRRKRLVMLGSLIDKIEVPPGNERVMTVRDFIGDLESVDVTTDNAHKRYPRHSEKVLQRIKLTPRNGGSRKDLPAEFTLECHTKKNVGFNDVYGRLRWDDVSSTITGGCLNPSKGRFLHPEEDRCITAREAALLQTFRRNYYFPDDIPISSIALMIGNALPPEFCKAQGLVVRKKLDEALMCNIVVKEKPSKIIKL
ncbi:DNA cytosine methyltransferase [Brevibacillus sp. AY1]|uniref:DNA cytosine methyltransferase n=1 Tax=Brevibacillus sp. AY1 TaxID=2807621 RepID=UPI00245890FA|nr:DNA cytosine methyltransferase [Brevibacillus sp. AY1]MDH4617377.1 DNA cytosine methyltransferase [Brevibacillus sp. AY1]